MSLLARNSAITRALITRNFRQSPLSKNLKTRDSAAHGEHGVAEHADHGDHGHHGYPYPGSHIPFSCYDGTGPNKAARVKVALQLGVPISIFAALPIIGFIFQQSKLG